MATADDPVALMALWGRAHARQRPFQMDLLRRRSAGQLAAVFGPAALRSDIMFRSLNCVASCQTSFAAMPADQRDLLDSYAKGVNAQLRRSCGLTLCHSAIGRRMRPWTPIDSLLVIMSVYFDLSFELPMQRALRAARGRVPQDVISFLTPVDAQVGPPDAKVHDWLVAANRQAKVIDADCGLPPIGSNAFTLPAGRSATGRAMLVCDTHLGPSLPNTWHRAVLYLSGRKATGLAIPGVPALMIGANPHLAWGVTNLPGDTVRLHDAPPTGDKVTIRQEVIHVRGRRKPLHFTAKNCGNDNVLYRGGGRDWISWKALRPGGVDLGIAAIWQASSVAEASDIIASAGGPPLTVHLADDAGQTGATLLGKVALRAGLDAHVHHRQNDKPIISANDAQTNNGDLAAQGWNHAPAHRARRLADLLDEQEKWTATDCFALLHDVRVAYLAVYRDLAVRSLQALDRRQAARALEAWDGSFAAHARNADLVLRLRRRLRARMLGGVMTRLQGTDDGFPWRNTEPALLALLGSRDAGVLGAKPGTDWDTAVADCVKEACGDRLAAPPVRWDRITSARKVRHVLGPSPLGWLFPAASLPMAGSDDCVAVCTPEVISAVRFVACPGLPGTAILSMPGGQSENPFSRHYTDMHAAWLAGVPMPAMPTAAAPPKAVRRRPWSTKKPARQAHLGLDQKGEL